MPGNRRVAEQIILDGIAAISNHKENVQFYKDKFSKMGDKDFEKFIEDLESGKINISIVEPNFSKEKVVDDQTIMEYAKKLGHDFMQKLYIEGKDDLPTYKTPVKYPVYLIPIRRASQLLTKKISVPPHTKVRDLLTGQVTGESKGATVSGPETQLLAAMGAHDSAIEMLKYRGGDAKGEAALVAMLSQYGRASQKVLEQFSSGVQATSTVRTFLTSAMHRVNL